MKLLFRILLPLLIVGACVWGAYHFISSKEKPRSFKPPPTIIKVEATKLKPQNFQIYLETRGTVRPRTTTTLIPEVAGRIIKVSPNFREGSFFEKDEILLTIDRLDYETAKVIAESSAAQARSALREEEVRGKQAADNWKRLGKSGKPSEMVLREPQLAEAKARLAAAEAEVKKAERNLERTAIRAPFAGRMLEQQVDVGQYVSPGTQLGRAFATDVMEVRLPLTNRQLEFVDLPESGKDKLLPSSMPKARITGGIGRTLSEWSGRIIRADSMIDQSSRQLFVVAEIEDPYRLHQANKDNGAAPLKIGMFVNALVKGDELKNVFVLPRNTVRVGGDVVMIGPDNRIQRKKITPIWSDRNQVVVVANLENGLKEGDILCLTPLAYPTNGALVHPTIDGVTPITELPGNNFGGKGDGRKKAPPARPDKEGKPDGRKS